MKRGNSPILFLSRPANIFSTLFLLFIAAAAYVIHTRTADFNASVFCTANHRRTIQCSIYHFHYTAAVYRKSIFSGRKQQIFRSRSRIFIGIYILVFRGKSREFHICCHTNNSAEFQIIDLTLSRRTGRIFISKAEGR